MVPILIAIVYFVFFGVYFGMKSKKKLTGSKDFFTASNRLGWFAVMCSFTLAPLGGGHTTSLIEQQGFMGVSVLWWSILTGSVFVPIFMYWFGPWFRKLKVDTFPQALGKIFGPKIKIVNTCLAPAGWLGITMAEILGIATVIYTLTGGRLAYAPYCVLIAGALSAIYVLFGGMLQASYMNIINAVVLLGGGFLSIIYMGNTIPGGYASVSNFYESLGEGWRMNLFNFTPTVVFGIIIPVIVLNLFSVSSEHALYQPILAAKDEASIRKGAILGGLINSFASTPFVVLGITALAVPSVAAAIGPNVRLSVAELALQLMPPWLIGILMCSLLAALLSTSSGMILAIAHVVTDDIIKPIRGDKMSEKNHVRLSRWMVVIVTAAACLPALKVTILMGLFFWCFSLSLPIFINYLIGLLWKINRKAAWINLICSVLVNFWWTFATPSWCPPQFVLSFYPVFAVSVVLGIILNIALPGEKGMLRKIKDEENLIGKVQIQA
ncbi:sodium:solute symporter family protein [Parasporobacterium paucivorans]|uniref:Solute:Na+ symporter, SSS family n=1 Tax=Parasporobacterium paucivorans DSM 15970 TaxID=1122934 RepID=A0A1M6HUL7_9FIRM|nr:sodium:solute symporter family protein [Parasporobacterium paucivorans]SHJ25847.1 solute:Na+ symporter, SSS family [Parasporobacterium paucivorans DSM 15970]